MTAAASRPARRPDRRPVARLSSPGEIVALVPVLCGFAPTESLVVVSLRGARKRVGLTMRFDLPWVLADVGAAAQEVAARLHLDGAAQAVLVVFTDDEGPLVRSEVVAAVEQACQPQGIALNEALLVRDDTWWSYVCDDPACCPPDGTPLASEPTPALRLVEAERVLEGRAVLASRDELVASVAPPVLLAAAAAEDHLDRAVDEWLDRFHREGLEPVRRWSVQQVRELVDRAEQGHPVDGRDAARLAVAVQDLLVRDEVATWCLLRADPLLSVLLQASRLVLPPEDAAVLGLLAWVAYAGGDGGLANVALDRCLQSDASYSLAGLLQELLVRQVPPAEVRRLLTATAEDLRRRRP